MATAAPSSSLSPAQEAAMAFLPLIPSFLSIVASFVILRLLLFRDQGLNRVYKRILFGMSVCDLFSSATICWQPFLVPTADSRRRFAVGNTATCVFLGFSYQVSLSSAYYSGMLTFYYLFTIRYGWSEKFLVQRVEPWMHVVAAVFPLVSACLGAAFHFYSELAFGPGCWVAKDALSYNIFGWIVAGAPGVFLFFSVFINNWIIYSHVRRTLRQSARLNDAVSEAQAKRVQAVAVQAFLFVAAFWGTWVWHLLFRTLEQFGITSADEAQLFPLLVLYAFLTPLQGFFNLLIYLRPRYLRLRKLYPDAKRIKTATVVLFYNTDTYMEDRRVSRRTQPSITRSHSRMSVLLGLPAHVQPQRLSRGFQNLSTIPSSSNAPEGASTLQDGASTWHLEEDFHDETSHRLSIVMDPSLEDASSHLCKNGSENQVAIHGNDLEDHRTHSTEHPAEKEDDPDLAPI